MCSLWAEVRWCYHWSNYDTMLVRRTLDRYTRYAQTLIVITVSDLDQVLTCGNVKVNKTKFVALSNMKYNISTYCEAQGKGRARGLLLYCRLIIFCFLKQTNWNIESSLWGILNQPQLSEQPICWWSVWRREYLHLHSSSNLFTTYPFVATY